MIDIIRKRLIDIIHICLRCSWEMTILRLKDLFSHLTVKYFLFL